MRVQFPLKKQKNTNLIIYPDDISLFSNVSSLDENTLIADYTGSKSFDLYIDPNQETFLHIEYPQVATINSNINIIVSVKFADGSLAHLNATYYVPIKRECDGLQGAFIEIIFVNGTANITFHLTEPGIYIMDPKTIRPLPTATITTIPEIIVKST